MANYFNYLSKDLIDIVQLYLNYIDLIKVNILFNINYKFILNNNYPAYYKLITELKNKDPKWEDITYKEAYNKLYNYITYNKIQSEVYKTSDIKYFLDNILLYEYEYNYLKDFFVKLNNSYIIISNPIIYNEYIKYIRYFLAIDNGINIDDIKRYIQIYKKLSIREWIDNFYGDIKNVNEIYKTKKDLLYKEIIPIIIDILSIIYISILSGDKIDEITIKMMKNLLIPKIDFNSFNISEYDKNQYVYSILLYDNILKYID